MNQELRKLQAKALHEKKHIPQLWLARNHHITHKGKRLDFKNYKYLQEIYSDNSPNIYIQKSTQCFPGDTGVWTSDGPIKISDISIGDMVWTHNGRLKKVTSVMKREVDEELIRIKSYSASSITSTAEHPFYSTPFNKEKYHYKFKDKLFKKVPNWVNAGDLDRGSFVYQGKCSLSNKAEKSEMWELVDGTYLKDTDSFRCKGSQSIMKLPDLNYDFGRFVGFYLSEGWARIKSTEVGFGFHINEVEYAEFVSYFIDSIHNNPISSTIEEKKHNCRRVVCHSKMLNNLMTNMCGVKSDGKRVPSLAFNAGDDFGRGLLRGYFEGDGGNSESQIIAVTVSKQLCDGIRQLLRCFGINSGVSIENSLNRKVAYRIRVSGKDGINLGKLIGIEMPSSGKSFTVDTDYGYASRIFKKENYRYTGIVYNISVEDDESYIAEGYVVHNCGLSEYLIVRCFEKLMRGRSIFYVVPKWELRNRFVKNRFDISVDKTPVYRQLKKKEENTIFKNASSVSLKHFGDGVITFVGSNSKSGFAEFPADDVIIDELDYCDQENLLMTPERQSDSDDPRTIKVANPTYSDYGINNEIKKTDQKKWNIQCSSCNKWITPSFFQHLVAEPEPKEYVVIDKDWTIGKVPRFICNYCKKPFDPKVDGEWVATYPRIKDKSGYYISKIFSTKVDASFLLSRFEDGLSDDTKMARFYNGDLGETFESSGSKITIEMLDACVDPEYTMPIQVQQGVSVMGIDVGSVLHIRIDHIENDGRVRAVYIGTLPYTDTMDEIQEIKTLFKTYRCKAGVIDSMPEMRLSRRVCAQIPGFYRWQHAEGRRDGIDLLNKIVTTDRNLLLDDVKELIITNKLILPRNAKHFGTITDKGISEYYDNMTSSVRTWNAEKNKGRGAWVWLETRPDHYAFSQGYTILARNVLLSLS